MDYRCIGLVAVVSNYHVCSVETDNPLAITKQKLERYRIIVSNRGWNLCTRDVVVDRFQEIGRRLCASHLRTKNKFVAKTV
jgi:hypothetical protein